MFIILYCVRTIKLLPHACHMGVAQVSHVCTIHVARVCLLSCHLVVLYMYIHVAYNVHVLTKLYIERREITAQMHHK